MIEWIVEYWSEVLFDEIVVAQTASEEYGKFQSKHWPFVWLEPAYDGQSGIIRNVPV